MNDITTGVQSRKRLLMAGGCAVLLISLVLLGLFSMFSSSRLNQRIAELRSQGLPTNAVELNTYYSVPPDVTDTTELWIAATTAVKKAGKENRDRSARGQDADRGIGSNAGSGKGVGGAGNLLNLSQTLVLVYLGPSIVD